MQFEFIDYDGGYPNLCFGRLKFKADGKIYEEVVSLISGGSVSPSMRRWQKERTAGMNGRLYLLEHILAVTYPSLKTILSMEKTIGT